MTIQPTDITKTYADRHVLDGIHLTVSPGSRVGLVGENGSGKSTLLRIAAGVDADFGGSVRAPADLAYIAQDSGIDAGTTVGDVLHDALAPLHDAVARLAELAVGLEDAGAATAYDELLTWCGMHEAWDADRRARAAAKRLGLEDIRDDRSAESLSGGQQSRLALAAMIPPQAGGAPTRQPDCVILDEPTNHLDDEALDFLADQLRGMHGSVLVASHDRVFLDRVCTAIVDLDPSHFGTDGGGGRLFTGDSPPQAGGTPTAYLQHKGDARRRWEEAFAAEQDELTDLWVAARTRSGDVAHDRGPRDNDKFIYGFKGQRVQATAARRARNAEQRITTIERDRVPKPPAPLTFGARFDSKHAGHADLCGVEVAGRLRLAHLTIQPGDKLLVTGANGAGKSTLRSLLAGRIALERGSSCVTARSIGLLTQEVELCDLSRSANDLYAEALRGGNRSVPLHRLGLLHPRDLDRPAGVLSLG